MVAQNMLCTGGGKSYFCSERIKFVTAVDLNKCLIQIKLIHTCAPISLLSSNIITRIFGVKTFQYFAPKVAFSRIFPRHNKGIFFPDYLNSLKA